MNRRLYFSGLCGLALLLIPLYISAEERPALTRQGAEEVALRYVQDEFERAGLSARDVHQLKVESVVYSAHTGVHHVYLRQQYAGIDVEYGLFTVNILPDGNVVNPAHRFVTELESKAQSQSAINDAVSAAYSAMEYLDIEHDPEFPFEVVREIGGDNQKVILSDGGVSDREIPAKLVWFPTEDGNVRLAWNLEIEMLNAGEYWYAFIDAETGEGLGKDSLVVHDNQELTAAATAPGMLSTDALVDRLAAIPEPITFEETDGASYRVYPLPVEAASFGEQVLVTNAADPGASPLGWHNDGEETYFTTRGNNVHAYDDRNATNTASPGSSPVVGEDLTFDFVHDRDAPPLDSLDAAIVNLFYWNNVMHDFAYNYGFDESAGNFQRTNFSGEGLGHDYVRAEAQDGSGLNNANFSTPSDGNRPRMQMFIFTSPDPDGGPQFEVLAPETIAGRFAFAPANFGGAFPREALVADVALVNDGTDAPNLGCEPLIDFPEGSIALVDRGACQFGLKALNAQQAGAIAVIVANNAAGNSTIRMAGGSSGGQVEVPTIMIGNNDGQTIRAEHGEVVASLVEVLPDPPDRDSDFDNGVIAHEYAHGISNRLTGGPTVVNCLNNAEQQGEGWSDWYGIVTTTSPADNALTPRGIGSYVVFQPPDGGGIRPTPLSTDMDVNPSTYDSLLDLQNITTPHGVGYVFNTMIWEVYWNLVHRYGYNPNIYESWETGGNNLAIQLVQDGMKLQPCRPGFEDARNAILAADVALTAGVNECEIWRGFAKRGLGVDAQQNNPNSRTDGVEGFEMPESCKLAEFGGFRSPVRNAPRVNQIEAGDVVPLRFALSGIEGDLLIDNQSVDCEHFLPDGEAPIDVVSPGSDGLKPVGGVGDTNYHLNWQTDPSWQGSCRIVTLRIPAEEDAVAHFKFF